MFNLFREEQGKNKTKCIVSGKVVKTAGGKISEIEGSSKDGSEKFNNRWSNPTGNFQTN